MIESISDGVRWRVVPEVRDQLLGPGGLRLDEWLRTGQARVVKHGPHRTVYRVELPGLRFYLKHYRLADARAWLRELVRPSKARMEYKRARAVAARGVPTVEPLAVGERRPGPAESFLVTRSLDGTETLTGFLETVLPTFAPIRQARVRQSLAVALARLVARMHDAGIVHHDLHPGNLLIRLENDDRPTLFLIDLHAVQLRPPLDWPARRANLILLNRWFVLRVHRSDRLRFWRAYRTAANLPDPLPPSESGRHLEKRTWASNLAFWRGRDRRSLVSNRYYRRCRSAVARGHAVRDLDGDFLQNLLADPDAPFRRPDTVLLKDSRSSTVAEFDLAVNGTVRRVIYKRFRTTGWTDPWKALLRRSPALRSWMFGHGLRDRCLPTPRPLAVLHRRRAGLKGEGYLLTEKVPRAVDLRRFLTELQTVDPELRRMALRRGIDHAAQLIRELHRRHLAHRDLKASNLLIDFAGRVADSELRNAKSEIRNPKSETNFFSDFRFRISDLLRIWLIDLVGIRRHRKLPRSRKVQNLARLHASFHDHPGLTRTDKLRFLRVYLQWGLRGRPGWKRWWRQIAEATAVKVARNRDRHRPLT